MKFWINWHICRFEGFETVKYQDQKNQSFKNKNRFYSDTLNFDPSKPKRIPLHKERISGAF